MNSIKDLFFELLQVSIGTKENISKLPVDKEWSALFHLANKHSLTGVLFEGMEKVLTPTKDHKPKKFFSWFAAQQNTKNLNLLQNKRTKELSDIFRSGGFRSCILKGQGTSQYYNNPLYRQCGDIDIWVEGERDEILDFARKQLLHIGHVDIKHSDIDFFVDVPVEVHFLPSWMYNPFTNKILLSFFNAQSDRQFSNFDEKLGFARTTVDFDLVFSIVHIYRHVFSEGIGLRQLVDYYFILLSSTKGQRLDAMKTLIQLKMRGFVGGIMWILKEKFGMKEEFLLCPTNKKHGAFLLHEILVGGNFGQYDKRTKHIDENKKFKRGFVQFKKNLRFVTYYPSEVLWSPFWKLWHWCWRKKKGYL